MPSFGIASSGSYNLRSTQNNVAGTAEGISLGLLENKSTSTYTSQQLDTHIVSQFDNTKVITRKIKQGIHQGNTSYLTSSTISVVKPSITLFPLEVHRKTARDIYQILTVKGFEHNPKRLYPLDFASDRVSSEAVFSNLLKILDPNKFYFTSDDIKQLQKHQENFLTLIKEGDLHVAFNIFNKFINRKVNRLSFILSELAKGIDEDKLKADKVLLLDSAEASWFENIEQQQEYWHDCLYHEIICSKLSGRDNSSTIDYLTEKYSNEHLKVISYDSDNAFEFIIMALTQLYYRIDYISKTKNAMFYERQTRIQLGVGIKTEKHIYGFKITEIYPDSSAVKSKILKEGQVIKAISFGSEDCFHDATKMQSLKLHNAYHNGCKTIKLEIISDISTPDNTIICELNLEQRKLSDYRVSSEIIEIVNDTSGTTYKFCVIKIPDFHKVCVGNKADVVSAEVQQEITKIITAAKIDGLIIDLRNNSGGSAKECNKIIAMFVENYSSYIITCTGKNSFEVQTDPNRSKDKTIFNQPLLCLVNHNSASASEKFANAIQCYQRGLVVGETTYGKGVGTTKVGISYGYLNILYFEMYDVTGKSWNIIGVKPNISIPSIAEGGSSREALTLNSMVTKANSVPTQSTPITNVPERVLRESQDKSDRRKAENPYFSFIEQMTEYNKSCNSASEQSLNLHRRQQQQKQQDDKKLAIVNQLLQNTARSAVTSLEEASQKYNLEEEASRNVLLEAGKILSDYIYLLQNKEQLILLESYCGNTSYC